MRKKYTLKFMEKTMKERILIDEFISLLRYHHVFLKGKIL